ncbi:hypothetical protein [Mesobacillus subterraneus]|uniref:Uncharacterized protein n=1 Tax=Mesobacillus subterraneus TaxID=285983 RepID=A0A3R9F3E6_9BACI|nr:hypothetical protein [Mesobacillus subterraneus]RSD28136.1 hypothetical protein EJA10_06675 [Mesobacillus subterraneus]
MNLELIWERFLSILSADEAIDNVYYKKAAGIPFLYVQRKEDGSQKEIENRIRHASAGAMKGRQLHSETEFVRKDGFLLVFRHRFYVPQRKMFCCGNLCPDCIRLK